MILLDSFTLKVTGESPLGLIILFLGLKKGSKLYPATAHYSYWKLSQRFGIME
jgi:hypothetical protein